MQRAQPIIATVVALLLAAGGSTVAASAVTASLQETRTAQVSYQSALTTAQMVRDAAAESRAMMLDASAAGSDATTEAAAIVALPAGLLDAEAVAAIGPLAEEVSTLREETSIVGTVPDVAPPAQAAALRDAAGLLLDWAMEVQEAGDAVEEHLAALTEATTALRLALADAARSVSAQSGSALASAPLASAETRAAIGPAVTAVREALRTGTSTAPALETYSNAISALAASQTAAAEAAAQAEGSGGAGGGGGFTRPPINLDPGPQPTIIATGAYLPMCSGYNNWVFDEYVDLPGGSTYTISRSAPYDYILFATIGQWSLGIKTCTEPY